MNARLNAIKCPGRKRQSLPSLLCWQLALLSYLSFGGPPNRRDDFAVGVLRPCSNVAKSLTRIYPQELFQCFLRHLHELMQTKALGVYTQSIQARELKRCSFFKTADRGSVLLIKHDRANVSLVAVRSCSRMLIPHCD